MKNLFLKKHKLTNSFFGVEYKHQKVLVKLLLVTKKILHKIREDY